MKEDVKAAWKRVKRMLQPVTKACSLHRHVKIEPCEIGISYFQIRQNC